MILQDSQGRSSQLSKNRCRNNIPIVAWEYERNIQPISHATGVIFKKRDFSFLAIKSKWQLSILIVQYTIPARSTSEHTCEIEM